MDGRSSPASQFDLKDTIKVLLAEYKAIERMHAHYDILNMSMTAVITAGVFTVWGIVIQTAFQPHAPIDNPTFVDSVSVLALALWLVLSVWVRYMTIHRCIVIQKLNRSHEIESVLRMKQNSIFRYKSQKLIAAPDSDTVKRRPGGHTLELLLYLSLSTFGGLIALVFQWHIRMNFIPLNYILIGLLLISPLLALLWAAFCRLDAVQYMAGKVEVGLPWSILFSVVEPINRFLRWLLNIRMYEV